MFWTKMVNRCLVKKLVLICTATVVKQCLTVSWSAMSNIDKTKWLRPQHLSPLIQVQKVQFLQPKIVLGSLQLIKDNISLFYCFQAAVEEACFIFTISCFFVCVSQTVVSLGVGRAKRWYERINADGVHQVSWQYMGKWE